METMTGAEMIASERQRQIEAEGWTKEHDASQTDGALALAAACYAAGGPVYREVRETVDNEQRLPHVFMVNLWPWSAEWYKPKDRIRDLTRAGALIAAEIDRLQAAAEAKK